MPRKILLFWWSERRLMSKLKENYGDLLGKYLVEKISGKEVVWVQPKKQWYKGLFNPIYVTIGSVLSQVNSKCIVWGSGIITRDQEVDRAKFLAVRGPKSRERLLELGHEVPEVYGDPGLLLPRFYKPEIHKKYKYGIIPHYNDYKLVVDQLSDNSDVQVIDLMTNDVEETTDSILQCEKIISSSLHGLIIPHAYQIPAVWMKFSDNLFGDDVKFEDYFGSVKLPYEQSPVIDTNLDKLEFEELFNKNSTLPKTEVIHQLQEGLIKSCPFI